MLHPSCLTTKTRRHCGSSSVGSRPWPSDPTPPRREIAPVDAPLVPLGERIGASSHFTVCGLVQWLEHASTEEEVCDALEWFVEAGILRAKA